jgi:hypothetical protein
MLLTTEVVFTGTTETLPSIINTVADAGSVQGLETLQGVKVERVVQKVEVQPPSLTLDLGPRADLDPYLFAATYFEANQPVLMSVNLATQPAGALSCTVEKQQATQVFKCYPTRKAESVVVIVSAPNVQNPSQPVTASIPLGNLSESSAAPEGWDSGGLVPCSVQFTVCWGAYCFICGTPRGQYVLYTSTLVHQFRVP